MAVMPKREPCFYCERLSIARCDTCGAEICEEHAEPLKGGAVCVEDDGHPVHVPSEVEDEWVEREVDGDFWGWR